MTVNRRFPPGCCRTTPASSSPSFCRACASPLPRERKVLAPAGHRADRVATPVAGVATPVAGVGLPGQEPQDPPLPQLSSFTGVQALRLSTSEEFLTRLNGLLNLFEIDPGDDAILQELGSFRRQLGQIWLDTPDEQVQPLFESSFGDLYRKFLRSGYPGTPLGEEDRQLRTQLGRYVRNMTRPKAIQVVLAVLPFFLPARSDSPVESSTCPSGCWGPCPASHAKS